MSLIDLPKDIILLILLNLKDDDDIVACERLCKLIRSLVNFDTMVWNKLCIQSYPNIEVHADSWRELYASYGKIKSNVN